MRLARQRNPRRDLVFAAILAHIAERGFPPSVREIGNRVGLRGPGSVSYHLRQLEAAGLIEVVPDTARGIRVVPQSQGDAA